jgi:hypothetical protein
MSQGNYADGAEEALAELPPSIGLRIWGMAIDAILAIFYFLLISCIAIAIDLGLRWLTNRAFVEKYGLSPIIKWEVELIAFTLATVGTFLFLRMLIQRVTDFARMVNKRP